MVLEETGVLEQTVNLDEDLYKQKRYVPVAMVLETETEYHDLFR